MKCLNVASILSCFLVLFAFGCTETKKETQEIPKNKEVFNGEVKINYHLCGSGDTTIVLVHGWSIDQTYWDDQIEALCPDYKVVTMDVPGFGLSGKNRENWTVETYGSDVLAVINQLKLVNVILVGHSMGGNIMLEAALQDTTDRIIKLVGVDNFKDVGVAYDQAALDEINGFMELLSADYKNTVAAYSEEYLFHESTSGAVRQRILNDILEQDSVIAKNCLEGLFRYAAKETGQLKKLKQDLLLINSDATPTNTEGLDATGINYKVIPIHATGHYPMIEKPEDFNRLLREVIIINL